MKRALAILLAVVFIFSGSLSASAAAQSKNRIVYVASKPIPKAAAEYARDWFSNRVPVQDICDATGLTVEQVKKIKLCRGFTVEYFDSYTSGRDVDVGEEYYFPLLYGNKFVGRLSVLYSEASGYYARVSGGEEDSLSKGLNSLSSTVAAPIMFVFSPEGTFAIDSKNKTTILRQYSKYVQEEEMERQRLAISKMKKPSKVVSISAATAYPEKISSQQLTTGEPVLTVKDETNKLIYQSNDGGKTWRNNAKPMMHMSIEKTVYPKEDGKIAYTVHNNTKNERYSDEYFSLQKWNGQKWVKMQETDRLEFNDIGIILNPNGTAKLTASWGRNGIKLEAGQYMLIKKLSAEGRQFTCEAVFILK